MHETPNAHTCTLGGVWSNIAKGLGILFLLLVAASDRSGTVEFLLCGSIALCILAMAILVIREVGLGAWSYLRRRWNRA